MRYHEINESSKNLDKDIISKLDNYTNGEYYMSYTVIDKLGINPRSSYNTPIGIYSYPIVDSIVNDIKRAGKMDAVPYMGEAPFIWIFSPKDTQRGLYLGEYFADEYRDDIFKLKKYIVNERGVGSRVFDMILEKSVSGSKRKDYNSYIWNFTRLLSDYLSERKKSVGWQDASGKSFDLGDRVRIVDGGNEVINKIGTIIDISDDFGVKVKLDFVSSYFGETLFNYDDISVIDEDTYQEYIDFMQSKKFDIGDIVKLNNFDKEKDWYVADIDWFNRNITLKKISSVMDYYETISFDEFYEANSKFLYFYKKYPEKYNKLNFSVGDMARATNQNTKPSYVVVDIDFDREQVLLKRDDDSRILRKTFSNFYKANPEYKSPVSESVVMEYEKRDTVAKSSVIIWTYLLHKVLGYDFVDDRIGYGIIHDNEPIQAVFFNRAVIDVAERFTNPARKRDLNPFVNTNNTADDFEKIDQAVIAKWIRHYLKNYVNIIFPKKWEKSIPVKSSKLQAQMILNNINWIYYIKNINPDTVRILDRKILDMIKNLNYNHFNTPYIRKIWNHFMHFHDSDWPEGEAELLKVIKSDSDLIDLIFDYIISVRLIRWPDAEPYILDSPSRILKYARYVICDRWPEGERSLAEMYAKETRPSMKNFIMETINYYGKEFGVNPKEIVSQGK